MIRTIHKEAMGTDCTYSDVLWEPHLEERLGNDDRFRRPTAAGVSQPQSVNTHGICDDTARPAGRALSSVEGASLPLRSWCPIRSINTIDQLFM